MRGLRTVSYAMAGAALTLTALYLGPTTLVQRQVVGPQVTLVQIIDDIVPLFPLLFAVAGTLVLVSTLRTRGGGDCARDRSDRVDVLRAAAAPRVDFPRAARTGTDRNHRDLGVPHALRYGAGLG